MGTRKDYKADELRSILLLMKKRSSANGAPNREVFADSNSFLRDGILIRLMEDIRAECDKIKADNNPQQQQNIVDWEMLRLKAEIIFFALYQTQATADEARMLLLLVKDISDFITSSLTIQQQVKEEEQVKRKVQQEAAKPLFHLLVILQLCHLAAHQQTVKLYDREMDYIDSREIDLIMVGNSLEQSAGSKYGLDKDSWSCQGAKAFSSLVFAVFRQPEVDSDRANPADVEWFLHEACILRGYSYIRLCVLPIIQAQSLVDYEGSLFYYSILADLMELLSEIFRMSHYRHQESSEDFPYEFFPPTMEFYQENWSFYNEILSRNRHSRSSPSKRSPSRGSPSSISPSSQLVILEGVDTLEDVVLMYGDLMRLYPSFTQMFWKPSDLDLTRSTEDLLKSPSHPHHFIGRFLRCCHHYPSLSIPTLSLLAALGDGPGATTSRLIFHFIDDPTYHHWSWQRLLAGMEDICASLGPSEGDAPSGVVSSILSGGNSAASRVNLKMTSVDIPALLALLELIRSVSRHADIADILQTRFTIIDQLMLVLSCALPIDVKGTVFRCLAVFGSHSKEMADKIWNGLESFNISTENGNSLQCNILQGLKSELEEREVRNGQFPLSDGFLQLLLSLLKHGIPTITFTQPNGFLNYIEFVIDDLLLKAHQRRYYPDTPTNSMAQRWKTTARSIELLSMIIASYRVDSTEDLSSYIADFQETDNKQPKSAGFYVMTSILSNSRLTELLMQFLQHLDHEYMQYCLREHLLAEWGGILETLRVGFASSTKQSKKLVDPLMVSMPSASLRPDVGLSQQRRDVGEANCVFWVERSLANIIALFYEISIKEKAFLEKVKQSGEQLFLRKIENGRFLHVPFNPYNLSGIIAGNFITKSLAQLISIEVKTAPITPSLNVIAVKLLEYLSTQKPTWNPLSSSAVDPVNVVKFLSSNEIIAGFAHALLLSAESQSHVVDEFGEYLSMSLGGEKSPIRCRSLPDARIALRDAIISLLLTTLTPNQFSFSHELLGLHQPSSSGLQSSHVLTSSAKAYDCFDAVLALLRPYQNNFFQLHPMQAANCYELLFRLCQSPLTRKLTLGRLRQKQLDFYRSHLSFFLRIMSLELSDLIHWVNAADSIQSKVGDVFGALCSCVTWILKMCSLELVECQRRESDVHMIASTNSIVSFLLGDCGLDGKKSQQADQIVLVRVLEFAICDVTNICNLTFSAKTIPQLLPFSKLASMRCRTNLAGTAFGENNLFVHSEASSYYELVDIALLRDYILQHPNFAQWTHEMKLEALQCTVQENLKSRILVAADNMCVAWRQLADLLYLSPYYRNALVETYGAEVYSQLALREVLMPVARFVSKSKNCSVVVKEQLSNTFASFLDAAIASKAPLRGILLDDELRVLIEHLVLLMIASVMNGKCTTTTSTTALAELGEVSVAFIANAAACLNLLVQYLYREFAQSVDAIAGVIMRKHCLSLLDVLVYIVLKGDSNTKLVAFTSLSVLQRFCNTSPDESNDRGRFGANSARLALLDAVSNKNYFQSLLSSIRLFTTSNASAEDLSLFAAMMDFVLKLVDSKEGCVLVMESSFFQQLCDAMLFRRFALVGKAIDILEQRKYQLFAEAVATTFQLFVFMLQQHAATMRIIQPIAIFFKKNNAMIAHILNLRDANLTILELANLVTNCLVAFGSRVLQVPEAGETTNTGLLVSKLSSLLGDDMEATIHDCQALLSTIELHAILDPSRGNAGSRNWLTAIKSAVAIGAVCSGGDNNATATMTLLESRKVDAGSGIVLNILSFLRLLTQAADNRLFSVQSKTLDTIATLFCAIAAVLLDDNNAVDGRRAKCDVLPASVYQDIAENCICVFYNLASSPDKKFRLGLQQMHSMQQVLSCSEYFPPQSFVGIVGRWIRDRLEHMH